MNGTVLRIMGLTALVALAAAACGGAAIEEDPPEPGHPVPLEATIPEIQEAMEAGRISSEALIEFSLARIAAYDDAGPELNALIEVNPDARDEAVALDAERAASGPRGPLHGIPVVVKDNMNTADMPTTAGSAALEGFRPGEDAFQVRKLREAGAVIIAKANLFEFASGWETRSPLGGQTLNPYDPSKDPGGSSGGSAVAVAAGFAVVGLGTDTCGSVRLPAAYNNLFGLRPTSGLSSRAGVIPLSTTLDTVGPIARSVVDLAITLDATAGVDPDDPTTVELEASYADAVDPEGLEGRRIGVLDPFGADPDVEGAVEAALEEMASNGAELIRGAIPDASGSMGDVGVLLSEFDPALVEYLAAYPDAPVESLEEIVDPEASLDTPQYRNALARRDEVREAIVAYLDDNGLDALAYPTARRPAAPIGGSQDGSSCATASMGGLPALTVPAGFTSDGLPVGLELMGRPFDEQTLIAMAADYEAHTDHRMLPSTTPPLDAS